MLECILKELLTIGGFCNLAFLSRIDELSVRDFLRTQGMFAGGIIIIAMNNRISVVVRRMNGTFLLV